MLEEECIPKANYDFGNEANVPCENLGEIYQEVGYIEKTFECTSCADVIDNCLVCHSDS